MVPIDRIVLSMFVAGYLCRWISPDGRYHEVVAAGLDIIAIYYVFSVLASLITMFALYEGYQPDRTLVEKLKEITGTPSFYAWRLILILVSAFMFVTGNITISLLLLASMIGSDLLYSQLIKK